MNKKHRHPHLGEMISKRLEEIGMTKAEFGRRIHCSRQNVSVILKKESYDTRQLMQIGEVLEMDFFQPLSALSGGGDGGQRVVEMHLSFGNQRLLLVTTEDGIIPGGFDSVE